MDARQLEYFVAVAEELNFTRAAARCHVVQSALSYQIARLEREHGVTLFERTSRSVRLAAAGGLLLPRARRVLAELDAARAELAALAGVITGRLRLGMIGSTGQAAPAVERALAAFHRRHPAVEIAIPTPAAGTWPSRCAPANSTSRSSGCSPIRCPPTSAPAPRRRAAGRRVPRDHPLAESPADLAALAAASAVRRDARRVRAAPPGRRRFARAGVTRRIAFELGTSDAVVRFVGLGFGAARRAALGGESTA